MTLVDSSLAVDFLRGTLAEESMRLMQRLLLYEEIAISHLIWTELYQGARGKREEQRLNEYLKSCKLYSFDKDCWFETAKIGRTCIRNGVNVPLSDIQIQACANRYGLELIHNDKHFELIQEAIGPKN